MCFVDLRRFVVQRSDGVEHGKIFSQLGGYFHRLFSKIFSLVALGSNEHSSNRKVGRKR